MLKYGIFFKKISLRCLLYFFILCTGVPVGCSRKAPVHPVQNPPKKSPSKWKKRWFTWFPFLKKKDADQQGKKDKVKSEGDGFGALKKNKKKKRSQIEHGLFPKEMKW